jgi:glycosyltransferase involved in cell wall biosynthesis
LHSPAAMTAVTGPMGPRKKLYLNMLESADVIVSLSSQWKSQIAGVIKNPGKINVVYNPCISNNRLTNINKQNQILFAGNLNRLKGYEDLINAFSLIARKHNDWTLVFAGNGEIENGRVISKKLNLENHVVFKGWVSGREKEELFSSASIFCLPSYSEGFPMAILDAWAYGLPVIATPVGGLPEVLIHGVNALVCNPGDIACLANSIDELITNEELRSRLSRASIELKEGQFSISTISGQLSEIYASLNS